MNPPPALSMRISEYVILMAMLMSLVALSIDSILPAMILIGEEFAVANANDIQYIVSFLFFGLTLGQLVSGPLSDTIGRKPVLYWGIAFFILGSLICAFSQNYTVMLAGRFLQGFGVAAPRILTVSITRDLFEGREMARMMSIIMGVFIFVPVVAPAIGQGILLIGNWHAIFAVLILWGVIGTAWAYRRLPETLPVQARRPFNVKSIGRASLEVMRHPISRGYTLCAGFVFACLIAFISTAAQIFQGYYELGERFPLFFAMGALSIGVASFTNSAIVRRFGMRAITHYALLAMLAIAVLTLVVNHLLQSDGFPLTLFMVFLVTSFFCCGLLFGNMNALAMEPMGHIAGVASAIIGTVSSLISLSIGTFIAQHYHDSPLPIVLGFAAISVISLLTQWRLRHEPLT
ncbi:MAG: Bcr/CflA family drug resistance efflux transporter [Rickettsiales bacterium]|nr:Bcr/CflA family drug resistance efflux transporter [Rickettsiales bacterium]